MIQKYMLYYCKHKTDDSLNSSSIVQAQRVVYRRRVKGPKNRRLKARQAKKNWTPNWYIEADDGIAEQNCETILITKRLTAGVGWPYRRCYFKNRWWRLAIQTP